MINIKKKISCNENFVNKEGSKNRSVDYFLSHPIQYISPLLSELSKEVDLNVYYYSDHGVNQSSFDSGFGKKITWDIPLLDGYKYVFLKNISRSKIMDCRFFDVVNLSIFSVLFRSKSKVIIVNGWSYSTDILIILSAWFYGKKVWLRAENPLYLEFLAKKWKQILKKICLKYFLFLFVDRFLYIGSESKRFFEYYDMKNTKFIFTPYAVDNDKFKLLYSVNKINNNTVKGNLGIPIGNKVILFCGKFISVKRPFDLLNAFRLISNENYSLVLVGDGPLNDEIQNYIVNNKINNIVTPGFVNQSEIYKYYSIADVFVLCSERETWGLAVNEALNFNVPCVVSDQCGCSFDLIQSGKSGYVFNKGNVLELKNQILNAMLIDNNGVSELLNKEFEISKIIENIKINL